MKKIKMTLSEPKDLVRAVEIIVASEELGQAALEGLTMMAKCAWNKNVMELDAQPYMDTRILERLVMFRDVPLVTSAEDAERNLRPILDQIMESYREGDSRAHNMVKVAATAKLVPMLHEMAEDLGVIIYRRICAELSLDPMHFVKENLPPKEEMH